MTISRFSQYSSTPASNVDVSDVGIIGASSIRLGNDAIQGLMAHIANHFAQDTIASATTPDLGAKAAHYLTVSGTTTITGFGTVKAGIVKALKFDGILTLTHNATSLILPGAINITTRAGDTAVMVSEGSGNWRCVSYQKSAFSPPNGLVVITEATVLPAANTVTLTDIPQIYSAIMLIISGASLDTSTRAIEAVASVDNGSSFLTTNIYGNTLRGTTVTSQAGIAPFVAPNNQAAAETMSCVATITGYAASRAAKIEVAGVSAVGGTPEGFSHNFMLDKSASMNALRIRSSGTGNFDAGTYTLYGVV